MKQANDMKVKMFAFMSIVGGLATSSALAAERHTYLIGLSDAPIVAHAHAQLAVGAKTLSPDRLAMRRQLVAADSIGYAATLAAHREQMLGAASSTLGRALSPRHVVQTTNNLVAVDLSDDEAARVATIPGVITVRRERTLRVLTDAGPQWIGASQLWSGTVPGVPATRGEGIVIGIVDTGINPTHPSFAATGGDGYTIANPRGHYYGLCATSEAACTPKLIGIYDMTDEGTQGIDSVGHGSHVSGIAAGDAITDSLFGMTVSLARNVSGVAPHANLIMYKACTKDSASGTCAESDLIAAIDQAVADGVDVINYSIGGDAQDPYALLRDTTTDVYAFFQARQAGVVVAAAAGNEGPGPASLDEPGNAPWLIGVANASHNRVFRNTVGNFSGAPNAPPALQGQGFTAGYGPASIVYAGDYGNALCGTGASEGVSPTGKSNPFPAGTFHGEIVICDRGIYARVEKGYNVKAGGAGGYVLANTVTDGETAISDDHFLPAVHLGFFEGSELKDWLTASGSHTGSISGVSAVLDDAQGDLLSSDSSRGPYGFSGGVLKPDVTAPGTNILSADGFSAGLALLSGTSMATPHVTGSAALVIAAHPSWSVNQVESALLSSAANTIRDGANRATPLGAGSGKVQPASAVKAGLFFPITANDFLAQDPARGGDPGKLNRPSVESENCLGRCTFTRTVADLSGGGSWSVSTDTNDLAGFIVTPQQFTLAAGASQTLSIIVDVSDPRALGTWVSGRITLHKTSGAAASDTAVPVSVYSATGSIPALQEIPSSGPGGNTTLQVGNLVALPDATFTPTMLVPATVTPVTLGVDSTPNDLYTTLPAAGKQFVLYPILPDGDATLYGRLLIVEIAATNAPVTRLFAGIDYNGNGVPDAAEQKCAASGGPGTTIRCVVDARGASTGSVTGWALVEIPQGIGTYSITVNGAMLAHEVPVGGVTLNDTMPLNVVGPGHSDANVTFPIRVFWDEPHAGPEMFPNTAYYGAILIDATPDVLPGQTGQVAALPLRIVRATGYDDVADALEPIAQRRRQLEGKETLSHQFVDVSGVGTLDVQTDFGNGSGDGFSFYVARADFPPASSLPQIPAAPAADAASPQWTITTTNRSKSVSVPVTPGRWYIVASNLDATQPMSFSLHTKLTLNAPTPPTTQGSYYNPARPGHGIFLSQGSGVQAIDWYTFLEDGTSVWYQAAQSVVAAGGSAWTSPLLRVTWDGTKITSPTVVGEAGVTPIDADNFVFSWRLFGISGSERFTRLTGNECVSLNGSQAGLDGQWFAPAQSGYGMDVAVLPTLQFDAFYLYDALGQPRWLVGSNGPFAANMTQTMNQVSGFCPVCDYVATVLKPVGSLNVAFADTSHGSFKTSISLAAPLSGSWTIDQPMARITGSATCAP